MRRLILYFLIILATSFLMLYLTGCEVFRKAEKNSSSNTSVKKENTGQQSGDTSKSKSNSTYTKETWGFAPRDTIAPVFNINVPEPKVTSYPVYYQKETGSKQEEITLGMFYNMQKALLDTIAARSSNKKVDEGGSVLSVGQLLMIGVIIFLVLCLGALIIYFQNKFHLLNLKIKQP